jgi:16S rRNA (cytidine1402-2'-O)-methyltransferase
MTKALAIGTLYIVATPIGNREDITLRAINTLKTVDLILAEDTRHSIQLLTNLGIKNQLSSLHAHNESDKSQYFIAQLQAGKSIALISDAGTPLICDPGFPLVKLARQHDIPVVAIPGACALIAALSAAGIPAKQNARKEKFSSLKTEPHTLIFYESTHRIIDCLDDLAAIYGEECDIVLAKELTKTFERFISGPITTVKQWLLADPAHTKGEFVLMIPPRIIPVEKQQHQELLEILLAELPLKQAVSIACKITKGNKNELYDAALILKK